MTACHCLRRQAPCQRASPFFPEVHEELTRSWDTPYSAHLRASSSPTLTSVYGTEKKSYGKLPLLDESVAAHLYPPMAIGWTAKAAHPSKPCRITSALAPLFIGYSLAGEGPPAFHSMAVLQVFQAKLLRCMDKAGPDPAAFRELCSATDLALCATKTMAQAFCRSIANLVVLECQLWLTLTEIMECVQCPLPGLSSLPPWPVRTHCGRVRRALHCGTEVVPGNARLPSSKFFLKPRHGYVPKVLLTAHFDLCAFSLRRGPGTEITEDPMAYIARLIEPTLVGFGKIWRHRRHRSQWPCSKTALLKKASVIRENEFSPYAS